MERGPTEHLLSFLRLVREFLNRSVVYIEYKCNLVLLKKLISIDKKRIELVRNRVYFLKIRHFVLSVRGAF